MHKVNSRLPRSVSRRPAAFSAAGLLCAAALSAQVPATDPLVLAKYDANRNGRLDPAEVARMEADQRAQR
ncbi:MAG: hypothetical protein ACKO4A_02910, partial [Gammaproteobacteria bacterium]